MVEAGESTVETADVAAKGDTTGEMGGDTKTKKKKEKPKVQIEEPYPKVANKDDNVFKGLGLILINAIKENDFTRALGMIMGGVELETADHRGQSPLHVACWKGAVGVVRLLLESEAKPNCRDHVFRVTPLHVASSRGLSLIVQQLIDGKAELDIVGIEGDTPLSRAAGRGHLRVVRTLLDGGANPDPTTPEYVEDTLGTPRGSLSPCSARMPMSPGRTTRSFTPTRGRSTSPQRMKQEPAQSPLIKATKRNVKLSVIKCLVEKRANLLARDNRGNTPLHIAAFHCNPSMVRILLQKNSDVQQENFQDRGALHYASATGDLRVIKMIVEHKADVNKEDKNQCTPLMCCGDPCGRKLLEKLGAKESEHFSQISPPISPYRSRSQSKSPERSPSPTHRGSRSPFRNKQPSMRSLPEVFLEGTTAPMHSATK